MRYCGWGLALALAAGCAAQVRYEEIVQGPADNWLTYAGDYQGHRHSALKQITVDNAGSVVPKWVYRMPKADGLRTSPIVYNGVMYVTASNEMRALDARNGRLIWQYKDTRSKKDGVNRGAAILGDRVFFCTGTCILWRSSGVPERCCGRRSTAASRMACMRRRRRWW